jgi:hypothetical protein
LVDRVGYNVPVAALVVVLAEVQETQAMLYLVAVMVYWVKLNRMCTSPGEEAEALVLAGPQADLELQREVI